MDLEGHPHGRLGRIRKVQELLRWLKCPHNCDMPNASAIIESLSQISVFQGSGPWWMVAAVFVAVLPKTLCGAADIIRALAEWSKARR
jgi:hypothetical protein